MGDRMLVGREREVAVLEAAIARATSGERAVLLISGEPGIGKTRLLEELVRRAPAAIAWGRTMEVGLTPAFWPWLQVLAALAVPGDPSPDLASLPAHADAGARLARFGEVCAFLVRRAEAGPLVIVLDDLHAADPSSLQLLEHVLPMLVGKRVLIAIGARDRDASPEIAAALGRVQRSAERLPLGRLARREVDVLVGDRGDPARVFELSEGNPLFALELIAHGGTLPALSSVRGVIRERLERLPADARTALAAAATLGRDFRGQLVAAMLGCDPADALGPAVRLGMLAAEGDRYRFSHALVAEAIVEELEPAERTRLHLAAARALDVHAPEAASALAHHLLLAGPAAGEAALAAAERAARAAIAQLAFEDAAAMLDRAIGLAADRAVRARLLTLRAEALMHASQHARGAELCDQAAAIARELGDRELLARAAVVRGLEFRLGRTDPVLVELLREALAALGDGSPALRARLLARLAAAEQPAADPTGPIARAWQAIELARPLGPRDRLDVMYVATAALIDFVEPDVLDPVLDEVLALARGTDRWITVHTRLRMCFSAMQRIDRAAFDAARAAFAAEAAALGLHTWTRHVHMLDAGTALLDGRFDDAARAASEAEEIAAAIGDATAPWLLAVHRAIAIWLRTAPVDRHLAATLSDYAPGRAAIRAWFAVQNGDVDEVRAALGQLAGRLPRDPDLLAMVANALAIAGEPAEVAAAYEALRPWRGRIVLTSMAGAAVMDLCDRLLLVLAARLGRLDDADAHALDALAIAERLGSPPWLAWVRADRARVLELRGRAGDRDDAAGLRAQALATADRLGMPGLAARCRAGTIAAPRAPTDEIGCERDGELWLVRGFGERVHVKDSRGMQMLARLIAERGRPVHALELAGATEAVDGGDAGPVLDAKARAAYRARLGELVAERDEAEAFGDRGRLERASDQIEMLTAELERAFGLGGRERKVGAAAERARTNVQRRIAHALEQIRAASGRLGEHLAATVKTGTYCVYAPR